MLVGSCCQVYIVCNGVLPWYTLSGYLDFKASDGVGVWTWIVMFMYLFHEIKV